MRERRACLTKKRQPDLSMGWWDREQEVKARGPTARLWAQTYAERDEILSSTGFESYAAYLASDLWRGISSQVLSGKKRCWLCRRRGKASQCHHHRYTRGNLLGKTLQWIYPVCYFCHLAIEFTRKRQKRTMKEAQKEFGRLRRWKKWPRIVKAMAARKNRRLKKKSESGLQLSPWRKADLEWQEMESEFERLVSRD